MKINRQQYTLQTSLAAETVTMKTLGMFIRLRCSDRRCRLLVMTILSTLLVAHAGAFHINTEMPLTQKRSPRVSASRPEFPVSSPQNEDAFASGRSSKWLENSSSSNICVLRAGGSDSGSGSDCNSNSNSNSNSNDATEQGVNENTVSRLASRFAQYCNKNYFLVGMFAAVALAKAFPALGKNGGILRPEVLVGNYGVALIFLLSGFSLQTADLAKAASNFKLNGLVNLLLFGVWPFCIGLPLRSFFVDVLPGLIPPALADGLLITTTLPTTVNMCIMLTSTGGGNAASAICNAVLSNLGGIVLTPLLLLRFFGATIQLPFGKMVLKLCQKVLLPVTIGQLLRTSDSAKAVYKKHSKSFKRLQETILLGIVWNAFCNAFSDGLGIGLKHSLVLLALLPTLHLATLAASFKFFSLPVLGFDKGERIAAMFCSSQKTLAFGLPLINTIFQGNPNLASFCAPLMFIHPLQMAIGSVLLPTIQNYTSGADDHA